MKRERIPIRPGDLVRCPDRATAGWHRVVRVGRRRDGTRYVTIRRGRIWRALGLPAMQRIEWVTLWSLGYGIKRSAKPVTHLAFGIDEHPDGDKVVAALKKCETRGGA